MHRVLQFTFLLSVVLASGLATGCGGDETTIPPIILPRQGSVDIRNGTWSIMETVTFTGDDSCLARPEVNVDTTDVLCNLDFADVPPQFPLICETEIDSVDAVTSDVTFDCRVTINLGICRQIIDFAGTGTVTDTTFDLVTALTTRLEPNEGVSQQECDDFYGSFVDACTSMIASTGTWISSDGDTICTDSNSPSVGIPLETFFSRTAMGDLWRQ